MEFQNKIIVLICAIVIESYAQTQSVSYQYPSYGSRPGYGSTNEQNSYSEGQSGQSYGQQYGQPYGQPGYSYSSGAPIGAGISPNGGIPIGGYPTIGRHLGMYGGAGSAGFGMIPGGIYSAGNGGYGGMGGYSGYGGMQSAGGPGGYFPGGMGQGPMGSPGQFSPYGMSSNVNPNIMHGYSRLGSALRGIPAYGYGYGIVGAPQTASIGYAVTPVNSGMSGMSGLSGMSGSGISGMSGSGMSGYSGSGMSGYSGSGMSGYSGYAGTRTNNGGVQNSESSGRDSERDTYQGSATSFSSKKS